MDILHNEYLQIMGSAVAVYLFVILAIRLFGKKELSQLSVIDLVFILLISNAVQNAMVGANTSLLGGLAAALALFITNFILKYAMYRFPGLSRIVQGRTILLIYKGKLMPGNLTKARISQDELLEAVREHGVEEIQDVDLAILEVDGQISVLSHDFRTRTTQKRKTRQGRSHIKK